jgi:hypothetical protein
VDHDLTPRIERAALGAMISGQRLAARLDCLVPADFTDPRHRAVFEAIRPLSGRPEHIGGNWRDLIAWTAGSIVTRAYLDELAGACPDPAHSPAYAAMLIQATVYRRVRDHANQIAAQTGPGSHLAEVVRAIRGHTGMLVPEPQGAVAGPTPFADPRPRSVQAAPARPAPPAQATLAEQREELVLAALLQNHAEARQILGFLPAAAFTSPARQEAFLATRRVHQFGRPVDVLTVSWEIAAHSAATAFLSPGTAPQPQSPSDYIDRLASADISTGRSPLRVARDLGAQLRHRDSRHRQAAAGTLRGASSGSSVQPHEPGAAHTQEPSASAHAPLIQPPDAARARPAGPEQKR